MVRAPNHLYPAAMREDATSQRLAELYVDRQLRIAVGPPPASLSVFVCEPYLGPELVELLGQGRDAAATIRRAPATQPPMVPVPRGTVFILNGIQDHKEKGAYVLYRELLVHEGYRVIQVDSRGHGRSTGQWVTFGVVESRDMVQLLDELERQNLIAGPVGVMGVSFGAATAIQWAGIDPRVRAVVALEPYATIRDAAIDAAGFFFGPLRVFHSDAEIQAALDRAGTLGGFDPDQASPLAAIQRTSAPVLLIHSRSDEFIGAEHSQRLHAVAPRHSRLILVDGNSHFDMWYKSRELIQTATVHWLGAHLVVDPEVPPRGSVLEVGAEAD